MSRNEVELVRRQVIEQRLLAALDDKTKVAILLNREDLDLLIGLLRGYLKLCKNLKSETLPVDTIQELLEDLIQLRKESFGVD